MFTCNGWVIYGCLNAGFNPPEPMTGSKNCYNKPGSSDPTASNWLYVNDPNPTLWNACYCSSNTQCAFTTYTLTGGNANMVLTSPTSSTNA